MLGTGNFCLAAFTAFSTRAEQAAQLIPVTENFFFVIGNTSPSRGKLA